TRWPRDWSSDVCSSDLELSFAIAVARGSFQPIARRADALIVQRTPETPLVPPEEEHLPRAVLGPPPPALPQASPEEITPEVDPQIGRATGRERGQRAGV